MSDMPDEDKKKMLMEYDDWLKATHMPEVFWDQVGKGEKWENSILIGSAGVGKSFKAAKMIRGLYDNGILPLWINVPRLLFDLRRNFDNEIVDTVLRKKYLVIDDLGAEKGSDWVTEVVYIIVNDFWEKKKNLVITSNLNMEMIAERFGDRLASRIIDVCKIEKINGKDKRLK